MLMTFYVIIKITTQSMETRPSALFFFFFAKIDECSVYLYERKTLMGGTKSKLFLWYTEYITSHTGYMHVIGLGMKTTQYLEKDSLIVICKPKFGYYGNKKNDVHSSE